MDRIPGIPEGRPGVWLVTADTAVALIEQQPGGLVHNLLGHGAIFIGCDWPKDKAVRTLRGAVRIALIFEPDNITFGHQLVGLNDEHRWAFDVGKIPEERMIHPEQGSGPMPRAQSGSVP